MAVYSTRGKDVLLDGKVVSTASSPEAAAQMAQNSAKKLKGTYVPASTAPVKTTATSSAKTDAAKRAQEQEAAAYKAAGVAQPVAAPAATPVVAPADTKAEAPPAGATLISGPSGLAGLSESQIWRDPNSSKIYRLAGAVPTPAAPTVAPAPAPTAPIPTPAAPVAATTAAPASSIPFKPGLSETQKTSITNLSKKTGQWTQTDVNNWNYATNGAPLPTGATAPVAARPADTPTSGETYKVQSGDTLSGIARANNTTVDELMRLNPQITNPNQIYAGKDIALPTKPGTTGGEDFSAIVTPEQANAVINSEQDADIASKTVSDEPQTRRTVEDIMAEIEATVAPDVAAPEVPDTAKALEERRMEFGVTDLETQVNDLQAQLAEVEANKRARIASERDKAVATNVISGRISEAERQENERIDALNRQLTAASNLLQTKYGIIDTLMKADATDYANASAAYDKLLSQNISLFNAAKGIEESEKSEEERVADNARANAQILYNSMVAQNQSFADLSPNQQATLTKLGVESGLGADFFTTVAASSANKEMLTSITSDDGSTVSVIYKDGSQQTFATGIKNPVSTPKSPAPPKVTDADVVEAIKGALDQYNAYGADGKVSWETYLWMRQNWEGTDAEFRIQFPISQYLDDANKAEYARQVGD